MGLIGYGISIVERVWMKSTSLIYIDSVDLRQALSNHLPESTKFELMTHYILIGFMYLVEFAGPSIYLKLYKTVFISL